MSKTKSPNTPELATLRRQMYKLNFVLYTFIEFVIQARGKTYESAEELEKLCTDMHAHMKRFFEKLLQIERDLRNLKENEPVVEAMKEVTEYGNRIVEVAEMLVRLCESIRETSDVMDDGWVLVEWTMDEA
jgi:hypothetical protein